MAEGNGSDTTKPRLLSREQILAKDDLACDVVEVPEWGGSVRIRELTGLEREEFDATLATVTRRLRMGGSRKRRDDDDDAQVQIHAERVRVKLCFLTMVDENGARMFRTEADLQHLGRKNARPLERVFKASARLSGIASDSVEEAADFSDADPEDDSLSA